jgi:hypothetical protein
MMARNGANRWFVAGGVICCLLVGVARSSGAAEPQLRGMKYTSRPKADAAAWQQEVRAKLWPLLQLDDLVASRAAIALNPVQISSEKKNGYELQEIEINSTPARRIKVLVARPTSAGAPRPAVVCIHGHGGNRRIVHEANSLYRGFAAALAERGYVTIAADVGQHTVYEADRTLMGERLWDLMRCVDYLESLPEVDKSRIGCGGLSLGGEMAMWLGGMDTRIAATASCGFLTKMDQMEQNHCLCWKFDGLRELVDFADIYALTAPRALLCQNGLQEPTSQFPVPLAAEALREVGLIYADYRQPQNAAMLAHLEGHIINLPGLLAFFDESLQSVEEAAGR